MPDIQEVFRMATQKVGPDPGALERQRRDQRGRVAKRKTAVYVLTAVLVVAAVVAAVSILGDRDTEPAGHASQPPPTSSPTTTAILPGGGTLEAGTYVASAIDPGFDASHRITIRVPEGYVAFEGWGIMKDAGREWVSASVVGSVYADPCHWSGTLLDPPVGLNFDALVAALENQRGRQASTPTNVTLAGYSGKRIELRMPAKVNPADCDNGQFRNWLDTGGGERNIPFTDAIDQLWILDVDGVPLVIEAAWQAGASAQARGELIQMVRSVRIDPR